MTIRQEIASRVLTFTDAELAQPRAPAFDDREVDLLSESFEGLALRAPGRTSADALEVPLALAMRCTGLRAWEVPRAANAALAAIDLDTRRVRFGALERDRKLEEHPPLDAVRPSAPTGSSARSIVARIDRIDARELLRLPDAPARYRVVAIVHDWVSNVVDLTLEGDVPPAPGRMHAIDRPPPAPDPLDLTAPSAPTYQPYADGLDGAAAPAVQVGLGPDPSRGLELGLWGSVVVEADAAHLPPQPFTLDEIDGSPRTVVAVVPLTIAIAVLGRAVPYAVELAVPIYGERAEVGDRLHGYFVLDLSAALRHPLPAGPRQAYAFVEGHVFGPIAC
jgi:hypothetical protein